MLLIELSDRQDKEWMNYKLLIELIQNALSQSSKQGASLLFTYSMLTAVSAAMQQCIVVAAF